MKKWNLMLLGLLALGVGGGLWWSAYGQTTAAPRRGGGAGSPAAMEAPVREQSGEEAEEESAEERAAADAFARRAMEALRKAGVKESIHYDSERFLLRVGGEDGGGQTIFLNNFYGEYQTQPPETRDRIFERMKALGDLPERPEGFAEARPALRPVVRPRTYFELLKLLGPQGPGAGMPVDWRPLGGALAVTLVRDTPHAMEYLSPEALAKWGTTFEEALAQATQNLRRESNEPLEQLGPGACGSKWDDSYAASRMLLDEVVRRCVVRGDPVVMVPHRDMLLITGTEEPEGLSLAAERAEVFFRLPRSVDGRALRRTARGWEPFMPAPTSPAWTPLRRLAVASLAREYAEQKERLEQVHARQGVDIFIATFIPYQDEHGRVFSQAVWTEGIDTLLPRADVILFKDQELGPDAAPVAVVRWELVQRDVGRLLVRDESLYPERYRVKGFPSEKQLERWKKDPTAMDVP